MKCKVFVVVVVLACVMCFSFTANAESESVASNSLYNNDFKLSQDVVEILESIGFEEISSESILNMSVADVLRSIADIFRGSLKKPLSSLCVLTGLIIVCAVGVGLLGTRSGMGDYLGSVVTMCIVLVAFSGSVSCIDATVDSMYSSGILMKTLIPAVAAFSAFSGNPSLAVSYNAVSMYCAQIITYFCSDALTPVMCVFSALSVCTGINRYFNISPLLASVKRLVNVLLGLLGTVYTGILALKDVLAVGIDKVAVKGIKFVIGSAVPVVGSALSEGLSSIIASVSLMRNTYGTIGIIVVTAVTLPAVCELILWSCTFMLSSYVADALGIGNVAEIINCIRYTVSIMLSVLLFAVYMLIISSAMIILLTGK